MTLRNDLGEARRNTDVRTIEAKFSVGQLVHHKIFDYRGVIVDMDPRFMGSHDWYRQMAKTDPPRDRPWYHVLVDEFEHRTYVAERNLEADPTQNPVRHPDVAAQFTGLEEGRYVPRWRQN